MNSEAVEDWLRTRRELIKMEVAFTQLALRVAGGEESEQVLQHERQVLEGTRELCTAAFQKAFPKQATSAASTRK
jgi:hypothetical protein